MSYVFNNMFTPLPCKLLKIYIEMNLFLIETNNSTVKKSKHPSSMNTLFVLALSQFFKINYLYTLKTSFFMTVDLILIVKSKTIIIALNTD